MTRLLPLTATLLAVAALRAFADDTAPAKPTPNGVARPQTGAADPNLTQATDEAKPTSPNPNKAGASNSAAEASTESPAPKPKPETPAERTARLTKLFRYEIHGDTRRLLDRTFAYPKDIAQLEADYDKCLDEERYADGEKVATVLANLLRERYPNKTEPNNPESPYTDHVLVNAWRIENALCQGAAKEKHEADTSLRRSIALTRWKRLREISETWTSNDVDRVAELGTSAPSDNSPSVAYLLLRALKTEERQPALKDDEVTPTVNAVLDRVTVSRPVWKKEISIGNYLTGTNLQGLTRTRLKDLPEDALLMNDLLELPDNQSSALTSLPAGEPVRRSQLGTPDAAQAAWQKADDIERQKTIHSTLRQLFPSETIEIHVVRSAAILRANLRNPVHELQIVSVVLSLAPRVLNQMTVSSDAKDQAATVAEKLEPIGDDPPGLREILARLYPKEHIEVHVLPMNNAIVLRGHLSRPEYAQQVYDIASTFYATILYQMTPALPTTAAPLGMVAPTKPTLRNEAQSPGGDVNNVADASATWVLRLKHVKADEAVRELQPLFVGKATIMADDSAIAQQLVVTTEPAVIKEVKAAIDSLDVEATNRVESTAPTTAQEAALDREARQLATKFRTAKLDEQPALRRQLEQLTERHFEQRQQRRQSEIEDLAHRVDVLRVTHHRRQENKTAVIQQRVQDLLDPNADLRWDEPERTQSEGSGTGSHQREATDSSRKKSASMPKDRP